MKFWPFRGDARPAAGSTPPFAGREQEVLLICHDDDAQGLAILENTCRILQFSKIPFTVLDLARRAPWPGLDRFAAIILCTEHVADLDTEKAGRLAGHVRAGGGMVVAYRCRNEHLEDLFGFGATVPLGAKSGFHFEKSFIPGASGLRIRDEDWLFEHSGFGVSREALDPDCTVLATDLNDCPLLWTRRFGAGRLAYWNTDNLFGRVLRGFILQTLLDAMGTGVAAIGGFAMVHIDDFPASLSDAEPEPIASEFPGLGWNGFMFDVWHRDMMALREKYGLRYTWYAIMNYQDIDTAADAPMETEAIATGQDVLRKRLERASAIGPDDELGFHGYNHQPLTADFWPDATTLRTKLHLARRLWTDTMPAPMPTSWVPANNWYDADCLAAIQEVFPEIGTVCSLYSSGDYDLGEFREFGPDPWRPSILCLPRDSFGFVPLPELQLMMLSQIGGMGVWTHFVHPDDVYDIPAGDDDPLYRRNAEKRLWRAVNEDGLPGLLDEFDRWIGQSRELFPWLEFVTTSEAERRYRAHIDNAVTVMLGENAVEITSDVETMFYVRTRAGLTLAPEGGGEIVDSREVEGGVLNVVRCPPGRTRFRISP